MLHKFENKTQIWILFSNNLTNLSAHSGNIVIFWSDMLFDLDTIRLSLLKSILC